MLIVMIPLAGIVGLFVGSFLNVVIYRAPLGLSVAAPRSFCPTCDRQLSWWENVPVVSWLGLRGRCRTCHEAISIRYPLVELATGISFVLVTWAWHGTILAAAYCVLAASMIAVGLIEYGGQRAPISVAAIGTGLAQVIIVIGGVWQHRWSVVVGSLVGCSCGVAAYAIVSAGRIRRERPAWLRAERSAAGGMLVRRPRTGRLVVGASELDRGLPGLPGWSVGMTRQTVAAGGPPMERTLPPPTSGISPAHRYCRGHGGFTLGRGVTTMALIHAQARQPRPRAGAV